jgi:hypothetical protein
MMNKLGHTIITVKGKKTNTFCNPTVHSLEVANFHFLKYVLIGTIELADRKNGYTVPGSLDFFPPR